MKDDENRKQKTTNFDLMNKNRRINNE